MRTAYGRLSSLWLVDFEFISRPGEPPVPLCVVAHELRTGRWVRRWLQGVNNAARLDLGRNAALVAYLASAEIGCFLQLGWRLPRLVIDLFAEHRVMTNGLPVFRNGLLDAMQFRGIEHGVDKLEKDEMRELAIRGAPYTDDEKAALLAYCETDVVALAKLLPVMLPQLDLNQALFRGQYMVEVARIEAHGVPVDAERLSLFLRRWDDIRQQVGRLANERYENVFKRDVTFSRRRFNRYLSRRGITWPRLDSGKLDLKDKTFSMMVKLRPELRQLRDARKILSRMRLNKFAIGADSCNRAMISPFRSKTGRNQPSNSKFLIVASAWLRYFVKPADGRAVAYIDYSQQEFAVAAALSEDVAMLAAYKSGDPYMALAIACGAAPADATGETHHAVREVYKVVVLATLYGMGARAMAEALGIPLANAESLLGQIYRAYPRYWEWSNSESTRAQFFREQSTCLGWNIRYPVVTMGRDFGLYRWRIAKQDRTMRNWPVQAAGAEILRIAIVLGGQRGVRICAPVHDAVLIEDSVEDIGRAMATMRACMSEAAKIVTGIDVRTGEPDVACWPDRYRDKKGKGFEMWEQLCRILNLEP